MTNAEPRTARSPVEQAVASALRRGACHPIPLVATQYDIAIMGGLAAVTATRTFRNVELHSIEATLTFPLPVPAVVYDLTARIGERVLRGEAKAKSKARDTYEDALDAGKTAVLHEELLKGIHMLSVGHVAPGSDVVVEIRFALPLSAIGGRLLLNIPLTAGQVYGQSGLPCSDELIDGALDAGAEVRVRCDGGRAFIAGAPLADGSARVSLAKPLVVDVRDWTARPLQGRLRDGRGVALTISPCAQEKHDLACAVAVDHSGSMGEASGTSDLSKHQATLAALLATHSDLGAGDRLHLFEFDDALTDLGAADAAGWIDTVQRLSGPSGGTEIGRALAGVIKTSELADIILITDGKSHAIDVQALAGNGRRFHVVLIGEDSLEANVGHLAALSGGEVFAPDAGGIAGAIRSALRAARSSHVAPGSDPTQVRARRAGMELMARLGEALPAAYDDGELRAVAAYVTGLRIPALPEPEAAASAEAEGLVTHLTSLVLVDEAGTRQPGLAATRKVPLAAMHVAAAALHAPLRSMRPMKLQREVMYNVAPLREKRMVAYRRFTEEVPDSAAASPSLAEDAARSLASIARGIDWARHGRALSQGQLRVLDEETCASIVLASQDAEIIARAQTLRVAPEALVVGLMALSCGNRDRHAARVARQILGTKSSPEITALARRLGLVSLRTGTG